MSFADHFSTQSAAYAEARPRYPQALFEHLAVLAPSRAQAHDVGCGCGQAAVPLAQFFDHVLATDPSPQQVQHAELHPRVQYQVAPAEQSPLPNDSTDLITVAQALHWFDLPRFFAEADRTLRPGGVLAAITYGVSSVNPEIDRLFLDFYLHTVGPYWPAERKTVEQAYGNITLPYPELKLPTFAITCHWTLPQYVSYIGTWSAVARYRQALGHDPMPTLYDKMEPLWGADPTAPQVVTFPLTVRACRKPVTGQ